MNSLNVDILVQIWSSSEVFKRYEFSLLLFSLYCWSDTNRTRQWYWKWTTPTFRYPYHYQQYKENSNKENSYLLKSSEEDQICTEMSTFNEFIKIYITLYYIMADDKSFPLDENYQKKWWDEKYFIM